MALNRKIAYIDLTTGDIETKPIPLEIRKKFLGGRGLDAYLLYNHTKKGCNPLGPGNALLLEVEHEHVSEIVTGFGRIGVSAERVAGGAAREMKRYLKSRVPVGEHLADQLLLPMALAGGGSFTTTRLSSHAATNLEVIRAFLDVDFDVTPLAPGILRVEVRATASNA